MNVSELIGILKGVMEVHGNLHIYIGNMSAPVFDLSETDSKDDFGEYGTKYLFIEESLRGRAIDQPKEEVLLSVNEAAKILHRSASWLAEKRMEGGIPFVKEPGRCGRVLFRKEDVQALYLKVKRPPPRKMTADSESIPVNQIDPLTVTCEEAALRHQGQEPRNIARMCLRGQALAKQHGGWSRVPEKEKMKALNARKVGKRWVVPTGELNRLFLGRSQG